MNRALTLLLIASTGCFNAPRETEFPTGTGGGSTQNTGGGTTNGGGNATGGGGPGGGPGGGAQQTGDGDATCDQSTCLPATGNFGPVAVPQLAQDADYLYGILDGVNEYTGSLLRLEKATGARRVLYRDDANPIDPGLTVRVRGGHVYFGKTIAGEIWGILARVPVAGGEVEELFDTSGASGSPHAVPYDVQGSDVYFARGMTLYRGQPPITTTSRTTLHTSVSEIRDVAVVDSAAWFVDTQGAHRLPFTAGSPDLSVTGSFHHLLVDGAELFALRDDGAVLHLNGATPNTPVATFSGAWRIARAGGKLYALKRGGPAMIVDAAGPVLTVTGGAITVSMAVDAQRVYLGTELTLSWKSTATPTATCGCAPTAPVIPAEAMACMRNLCPTRVTVQRALRSGIFDGPHVWGAFETSSTFGNELARYLVSGGGGVTFTEGGDRIGAVLGADSDSVYVMDTLGSIAAIGKQSSMRREITGDVSTYPYELPLAAVDDTHVYYATSAALRRVPKGGGHVEILVADGTATRLRLDDTHVYFMSKGQLRRVLKTGGASELLAEDFAYEPGYGLFGSHLYFLTTRGLERVKKTGGFKTLVIPAEKLNDLPIEQLDVLGPDLLVLAQAAGDNNAKLWRIKLSDGAREPVLDLLSGYPIAGLVIDPKGLALGSFRDSVWRERGCSCPAP